VVRRALLALAVVLGALALSSCRFDLTVEVAIGPDGTGTVTVVATVDAEVVEAVPDLAQALVFTDAEAAGWSVDGPVATAEGGLTVTLRHPVSSPEELANVLNSIGPPFSDMAAGRTVAEDQVGNAVDGTLVLTDGFASFADADLLAAVGGVPFAEELAASGVTPADAMSVTFRLSLPGEIVSTTGTESNAPLGGAGAPSTDGTDGTSTDGTATDGTAASVDPAGEVVEWVAPLDGSSVSVATRTVQRPAEPDTWAAPLATAALVAFVVWVVLAVAFITYVIRARRRRARRRVRRRVDIVR
jgi:hypothetical protein